MRRIVARGFVFRSAASAAAPSAALRFCAAGAASEDPRSMTPEEAAAAQEAAKAASVARLAALRAHRKKETDDNKALAPGEAWREAGDALAAFESGELLDEGEDAPAGHQLIAHSQMVTALRNLVERNPSTDPITPDLVPIPPIGQASGNLVVEGPRGELAEPVKLMPLMLIDETPKPLQVLTEIELVMRAWSEEQARRLFVLAAFLRCLIMVCISGLIYFFYRTWLASERRYRGVDNMPAGLRIGSVVYLDMSDNGRDAGRIVIGLLNENCPLYCEHFHRRCTGSGGEEDSFRGLELSALLPRSAALFGEGSGMTHTVPGYDPGYLPTEWLPDGPWRGALSSIAYTSNKESPNFAIHLSSGDFTPQVFGLVIAGFEVIERMSEQGTTHGCQPKHQWTVVGCGELCTLDKSRVVPLPWRLYDTVSNGFDEDKFGKVSAALPREDPAGLMRPRLLHPMPLS